MGGSDLVYLVAVKMGVVGAMMGVCARTCVAGSLEV